MLIRPLEQSAGWRSPPETRSTEWGCSKLGSFLRSSSSRPRLPTVSGDLWTRRLARQDSATSCSVVEVANGEVIGGAGCQTLGVPHAHVGAVGMAVSRGWQGRGVGRRLLQAVVDQGERWLGLRRLELEVYTDNVPAKALYESFGFQPEGIRRANAWRHGGFADSLVMARLR